MMNKKNGFSIQPITVTPLVKKKKKKSIKGILFPVLFIIRRLGDKQKRSQPLPWCGDAALIGLCLNINRGAGKRSADGRSLD